ncbi:MAG: ParB/RepB/Spo0J family partition protein, partial [Betaproteobacteria bacterium]|nr:ParB/RepB/Spo0J family partition protein [Betaproteobacteria bacterium]
MMQPGPETVTMVPLDDIEVMNPRDRNQRMYREIVENIRRIGLKKPITVTPRKDASGRIRYRLVCGEGRLNAYRSAGQTHIPALVIEVDDADAYVMSLVENIARRHAQPLEILARINALLQKGYSTAEIVQKTGLSIQYVDGTAFLL